MEETQFTLNLPDINLLDAMVYAALIFSAGLSMSRGFTEELTSHGAWAVAALVTLFLVKDVAHYLTPYFKDTFPATIFATAGTFLLAVMILSPIKTSLNRKYMRPGVEVGATDSIVGLGFGLFKGWILVTLGFLLLTLVKGRSEEGFPQWVKTAETLPALERSVKFLARGLPEYIDIPTTDLSGKQDGEGLIGGIIRGLTDEEGSGQQVTISIPDSDQE